MQETAPRVKSRAPLALVAGVVLACAVLTHAAAQDILLDRSQTRQEKLVEGAKKEGAVVFYSAMIVNQALRPLADAFMKLVIEDPPHSNFDLEAVVDDFGVHIRDYPN